MQTFFAILGRLLKRAFTNVFFVFSLGLVINIITWLVIRFQIRPTGETVSLHYTIYYTDVKGPGYYLYAFPAIGLGVIILNWVLYRLLRRRELFAGKMLLVVSAVVQFFVLVAILFLKSVILI